jgi:drug/metabolite transporter (DMT)-like permease
MFSIKPNPRIAMWALLFATAVWGSTFVVVQDGINQMPMMMFMGWRFVIATLVLIAMRPQALRMSSDTFKKGFFIGVTLALGYLTQTYGLYFTSATISAFITGMFVVLTPVAALVVYRMKIAVSGWLGVGLATFGLGLISFNGIAFGIGEFWTFMGAIFFSFQIMWLSRWATPETSFSIALVQIATTGTIFFVGGMFTDGFVVPQGQSVWIAIIFLAVFASAFAFIIQTWSQSQMTPTRAAVILSTEPVFGGLFGFLIAGDQITSRIIFGGLAILIAIYLVELGPRKKSDGENEAIRDLSQPHHGV